jgi:microcystin degradation protein MlrC
VDSNWRQWQWFTKQIRRSLMPNGPRIAVGGLFHETHTFADHKTTLDDFRAQSLLVGDEIVQDAVESRSGIAGMISGCRDLDAVIFPTLYAGAMPAGLVEDQAMQTLLDDLLGRLRDQLPVDGVLLALHGAMVTESSLDAETEVVQQVREIVGTDVPIVVELDMHGNISPDMVQAADVLVAYDTNPHIDAWERGHECAMIMGRILKREISPTAASVHLPILLSPQATGTDDLPLRAVHDRAREMEQDPRVVAVSVMGGFAYADTPFTGVSLIVTTNDDSELAERFARELAGIMVDLRNTALPEFVTPDAAVQEAMKHPEKPVILVDSADNIGGGSPGDGTDALWAMLEHSVQDGTIILADPESVADCQDLNVGDEVALTVGAKADDWHGTPVPLTGTIQAFSDGVYPCELPDNHFAAFFGNTIRMGNTVWLRSGGVNILLTERKVPPFDLAQLRGIGIIPEEQQMIVVKSAVAYRAAYMPIAKRVIEMDTAGLCTPNLARFPYQNLTRPIFPLDDPVDVSAWIVARTDHDRS